MLWQSALLIAGLLMLWKGSDLVVDASKRLAEKYGISHTVIGLTIVSIGTSLPEIFTILYSGFEGRAGNDASGLAVGTAIGSDVAQITLLLGITALIGTMYATKEGLRREGTMLLLAIAALFLVAMDGRIEPYEGGFLVAAYVAYLALINRHHGVYKGIRDEMRDEKRKEIRAWLQMAIMGAGLGVLVLGSNFVVENAIYIAENTGVSQGIIGVFLVGVGTSLPELSVAVAGMRCGAEGISLGTLVGSNITDPLFSLGLGAMVSGFAVERNTLVFDLPFWLLATGVALGLMWRNYKIGREDRIEGIVLITLYGVFIAVKLAFFA